MRIDKFLKNSRLIKRRTVAKDACANGRITLNGKIAKPGSLVSEGDVIVIIFGSSRMELVVKEIIESPRKEDAEKMYEITG